MNRIIPFLTGLLFGMGMIISQMVDPARVVGFLNVTGDWDPSLVFVMGGALVVFTLGYQLIIRPRKTALNGEKLSLPLRKHIDRPLLVGAALFGLGWGLAGICPGPAVAALTSGKTEVISFIVAMLIGQGVVIVWQKVNKS